MGARTGQEYVEALDERAIQVEIEGAQYTGRVSEIPQLRNVDPDVRAAVRPPARSGAARRDDLRRRRRPAIASACPSSSRRASTTSFAAARRCSVWAEYSLGNLGRTGDYCNSAVMAMAARGGVVRPGRPRLRRERPPLLRARARERPAADAHARLPAGEPLGRPVAAEAARRSRRASSTGTTTAS